MVDGYEERANGFWCICPANDDHELSLHVEEAEDGTVLLVCRAGCDQAEVLAALEWRGLMPRDLFRGPDAGSAQTRHFPFWSGLGVGSRLRKLKRPEEVLGASC